MYGGEAVIPVEVGLTAYKVHNHDENKNDEAMRLQLDLVDEIRAAIEQRLARYQDCMAKHYNSRVRHKDFQNLRTRFESSSAPYLHHCPLKNSRRSPCLKPNSGYLKTMRIVKF